VAPRALPVVLLQERLLAAQAWLGLEGEKLPKPI